MSTAREPVLLVVAKAPVAGRVKTRLGRSLGMDSAAGLAAAALLDTLTVGAEAYGADRCHLALEGDLAEAVRAEELAHAVAGWSVHAQRGADFAERLVHAHRDTFEAGGAPVVQVGMDTPHLTAASLVRAGSLLTGPDAAVLGPAYDGGWWLLGVGGPHLLVHLGDVPMSTDTTGELTREALLRAGAELTEVETLRDVDELEDAESVADEAPATRFAQAFAQSVRTSR